MMVLNIFLWLVLFGVNAYALAPEAGLPEGPGLSVAQATFEVFKRYQPSIQEESESVLGLAENLLQTLQTGTASNEKIKQLFRDFYREFAEWERITVEFSRHPQARDIEAIRQLTHHLGTPMNHIHGFMQLLEIYLGDVSTLGDLRRHQNYAEDTKTIQDGIERLRRVLGELEGLTFEKYLDIRNEETGPLNDLVKGIDLERSI